MSDTNKPSGAEILDNLQGVMSDAQMGRGDLTYIGAPKSKKRERDLSAYTAVADLIAERNALRSSLLSIHSAAIHHFSSCPPGPFKRMPPELRAAIAAATTPTQDKANDQQAE